MSELPSRNGVPVGSSVSAAGGAVAARAFLRLLRPRQWTKNLLLFAALVFAHRLLDGESVLLALLAFASFCLASSSCYVVNDLVDVERDRQHPHKRERPIASRQISRGAALLAAGALTAAAFALALWVGPAFAASVAIYVLMTHFYSAVGKNVVILDTMLVAAGFVIRAVAGAVAIDVPSSNWFILCTFFLALFLTAFFESVAGFGTPGVVVPLLLIGMGFSPALSITAVLLFNGLFAASGAVGTPVTVGLVGPLGLEPETVTRVYTLAGIGLACVAVPVMALLQRLNRELGKTIIMVTHDPATAEYARRTLHLDKGRLVESGVDETVEVGI